MSAFHASGVFYVETAFDQNGEPLGEFRLVKNGCTYAHAKARSTLCALRDLLNAPRTLEGQTVEARDGERAVVQSVAYDRDDADFAVLVRKDNDSLEAWSNKGLKVVTLDQEPSKAGEVSP